MKKFWIVLISAVFLLQWVLFASEQQDAYDYVYSQKITTVSPIEKADLGGSLTRIAMAKMISNFAINVLGLQLDMSKDCSFLDVPTVLDEKYNNWVTHACQLWLMWIGKNWEKSDKFSPYEVVTRAQFGTAFSRALSQASGKIVENWNPYYVSHLWYLQWEWVIKDVNTPSPATEEKRWRVMLMMYRASKNVTKNYKENDDSEYGFEIDEVNADTANMDQNISWNDKEESKLDLDNQSEIVENKEINYHRVASSYDNFLMDDFNAVEDVYKGIKSGDRVIFVVRHSERITNCTSEWWLTEHWVELAKWVWEKLRWAPFEDASSDFYWSSIVKRTVQTSYYVGESRGSEVLQQELDSDKWSEYEFVNHSSDINSVVYGEYFSNGNSYSSIEHLYEENKVNVNERALYMVNAVCKLTEWHPFSRITSHDWFTLPITEWATREALRFSQSNSEWPNFMQWVAIVVHKDWWWEIYPVKSLETGKMPTRENPWC